MILHLTRLASLVKRGHTVSLMGALLLFKADSSHANPAFNPDVFRKSDRGCLHCLKRNSDSIQQGEIDRETAWMSEQVDRSIAPHNRVRSLLSLTAPTIAQAEPIEHSPLFQRWQEQIPNVLEDIDHQPSFRTRVRLGVVQSEDGTGIGARVEEVFLDRSRFTVSGGYQRLFDEDRHQSEWDAELHYYLRPLGRYVNIAPVVGFRELDRSGRNLSGMTVGVRALLVLSRGGGGEISATQTWIVPTAGEPMSLTQLSAAYAIDSHWRLSTDWQRYNRENQAGIFVEWMP